MAGARAAAAPRAERGLELGSDSGRLGVRSDSELLGAGSDSERLGAGSDSERLGAGSDSERLGVAPRSYRYLSLMRRVVLALLEQLVRHLTSEIV